VKLEKDCDAYWQHARPIPLQATGTMTHTRPTLVHTNGGRGSGDGAPSEGGGEGGSRDESPAPSARGGGSGPRPGRQGGGRPPAQPNGGGSGGPGREGAGSSDGASHPEDDLSPHSVNPLTR
jgi:hypothetical protein